MGDEDWGTGGEDAQGEWVDEEFENPDDATKEDTLDVKVANLFYEADDLRRESPKDALEKFKQVVTLAYGKKDINDESKTNLFKSMVNITVIQSQMKKFKEMMTQYKQLLEFIPQVTKNEGAEAIDTVLMTVADLDDFKFQVEVYNITSQALAKMADSERMLFDVRMKLCKAYVNRKSWDEASEVLVGLHNMCKTTDGQDDKKTKGSELLEIYALELSISAAQGDSVKLKELFEKTKDLSAAVKDPRTQSVIRECWGKMYGDDGQWQKAKAEFFTAFIHYDEIGNAEKAKQCLKYVVVANMLSGAYTNVFDAREAKVYQNDKEIETVSQLRNAYEKCDVNAFGRAIDEINKANDPFIQKHLESMKNDFQARSIISSIKSYRRIKIKHLAEQLRVDPSRIEELLIHLILDGSIFGRIDQVHGLLDLTQRSGGGGKKYAALDVLTNTLSSLTTSLPQPHSST